MGITTIIFDLGRVLVEIDTTRGLFRQLTNSTDQAHADTVIADLMQDDLFRRYNRGEISPPEFHTAVCERLDWSLSRAEFQKLWCDIFNPLDGMEELLSILQERYKIGLLSDCDPVHWRYLRERFPFLKKIAHPTLSFEIGSMKPSPQNYLTAAKQADSAPAACFFTDDLAANVSGAIETGMTAVQFTGVANLRRELRERGLL